MVSSRRYADAALRLKLSHAGPVMSTGKAELKTPIGVGSSDL